MRIEFQRGKSNFMRQVNPMALVNHTYPTKCNLAKSMFFDI